MGKTMLRGCIGVPDGTLEIAASTLLITSSLLRLINGTLAEHKCWRQTFLLRSKPKKKKIKEIKKHEK